MKRIFGNGRYANVTSTMALIVALGGTSYAAIKLPANSVGNTQIKTNAVRSSDVKNGSLLGVDFKAGQLPAGPRGAPGATGAPGAPGATGATGAKGDKGDPGTPATKLFAHVTTDNNNLTSVSQGATALAHPEPGRYLVTFNRDLTGCVAFAQAGFVEGVTGSVRTDAVASTDAGLGAANNQVGVTLLRAATGTLVDTNFNVTVFC